VRAQQPQVRRLPERLQPDQLGGRLHGRVAAAAGEPGVDRHLEDPDQDLLPGGAAPLDPAALLARQQRPAGQRARRPGGRQRALQVAVGERPLGRVGLAGGQLHVDGGVAGEDELVAAGRVGQHVVGGELQLLQELADLADDPAQRRPPGGRRGRAPHRLGQLLARHRPVALGHQVREDHPALPSGQAGRVERPAVRLHLEPAGEADPYRHGASAPCEMIAPDS
jgi:hypothetical protein